MSNALPERFETDADFLEREEGQWAFNEVPLSTGEELAEVQQWVSREFLPLTRCHYCQQPTVQLSESDDLDSCGGIICQAYLTVCLNCHFWRWYSYYDTPSEPLVTSHAASTDTDRLAQWTPSNADGILAISKLRDFDHTLPEGTLPELAMYIRRHPSLWNSISPRRLELLVSEIFRANYKSATVLHVGKSCDGGKDIVLIEDDLRKWLISVKRRSHNNSSEGIETVRALLGTLVDEGERNGIVVSTACRFSKHAKKMADRAATYSMRVRLVNKKALDRLLSPLLPQKPWRYLVSSFFSYRDHERFRTFLDPSVLRQSLYSQPLPYAEWQLHLWPQLHEHFSRMVQTESIVIKQASHIHSEAETNSAS